MLAELQETPVEPVISVWGSPVLLAIGGSRHAADLAARSAQIAARDQSMVIVFTVAGENPPNLETGDAATSSWTDSVLRATSTLDSYRIPYRVVVDDRPMSSVEPDRTRELAWAIWDRSRRCRPQCVVIGRHEGLEPGLQVHRHLAAAGRVPVVTVPLHSDDSQEAGLRSRNTHTRLPLRLTRRDRASTS